MNNIERIAEENRNAKDFARAYIDYISTLLLQLDTEAIGVLVDELETAHEQEKTIFIIGNGGSAATASHMANDIGSDVLKKGKSGKAFRALALTDNTALMLAIANDDGYDNLFVNQLRIHFQKGDKLIAISASGNSPNVIAAAEWVKERGGTVIGLTGFDGGKLADISDVTIHVKTPKGEYGPVEDIHMILVHLVANWLQYRALSQ